MTRIEIPAGALTAQHIIEELFSGAVIAVYLYGSAVSSGLRRDSDVDILAVMDQPLSKSDRGSLARSLMAVSGRVGTADGERPLEVTVVRRAEVVPWRYPPWKEFIYGEWLRREYEQDRIPQPAEDPDLAIILSQVRRCSVALVGDDAGEVLALVPMVDVRRAMKDSLPELIAHLKGDERNVILTLARMWVTAETGEFLPKDAAAERIVDRLSGDLAGVMALAAKAYRGEVLDDWENLGSTPQKLVARLKEEIIDFLV